MTLFLLAKYFDKYKDKKLLCRGFGCHNPPSKPYRKFCSKECFVDFNNYYEKFHFWRNIRWNIMARDNSTCQVCMKQKHYLEVDHIMPQAILLRQLREKLFELRNHRKYHFKVIKRYYEIGNAEYNLRTLCKDCHNKVRSEQFKQYNDTYLNEQNNRNHFNKIKQQHDNDINRYYLYHNTHEKQFVDIGDDKFTHKHKVVLIDEVTYKLFGEEPQYYAFNLFLARFENGKKELLPLISRGWYQTTLS